MFETKKELREANEILERQLKMERRSKELYRHNANYLDEQVRELEKENNRLEAALEKLCNCPACCEKRREVERPFGTCTKEAHSSPKTTHIDILYHFDDYNYRDYFFMIAGKPGPTGKTWLWDALTRRGFKAVELTESLEKHGLWCQEVNNRNGYTVDHKNKTVLIVLNKPLDMELYRLLANSSYGGKKDE